MWARAKETVTIVVFTILIWLTADQFVQDRERFTLAVRIGSTTSDRYATIDVPGGEIPVSVTMVGRRRDLTEFARLIDKRNAFESPIDPDWRSGAAPESVSAREILGRIKEIAALRVSLEDIDPRTVPIKVDDYVTVSDVTVKPAFGELKVGNPICTPSTVVIRVPAFASDLVAEREIAVDAEVIVRQHVQSHPLDPEFEVSAPVTLADPRERIDRAAIRITPEIVRITGVVETLEDTRLLGPIPLKLLVSERVQNDYDVRLEETTNTRPYVTVAGPEALLEQVAVSDVRAYLEIEDGDIGRAGEQRTREIDFVFDPPTPGVRLHPDPTLHQVRFRLERRAAPGGGED